MTATTYFSRLLRIALLLVQRQHPASREMLRGGGTKARLRAAQSRVPGAGTGCPFAGRRDPRKALVCARRNLVCLLARQLLATAKRANAACSSAIAFEMLGAKQEVIDDS